MLPIFKTVFKILIILSIIVSPVTFNNTASGDSYEGTGIVEVVSLNVRMGPDRNQLIIYVLKQGTEVNIIENIDGWLKISFNGHIGYIRNRRQYVRIEAPDAPELQKQNDPDSGDVGLKIEKHEVKYQEYSKEEIAVISNLDELDFLLHKLNQRISALKIELEAVDKKIDKTTLESNNLIKEIDITEDYISKRLVALYKLNLIGHLHVLASADSMYEILNRKFAMEHILSYDENILKNHIENKERLIKLLESLNQQKKERIAITKKFNAQKDVISSKKTRRVNLLNEIRDKKSLALAAIESLKQAGKALDQTIKSLHVEPGKNKKIPMEEFETYKGLLSMPVKGKILSFFGPYKNKKFNVTNFHSGIEIKADRGEPIRAVLGGIVLYSGWFKSYGNMIIIDHGHNYYTVYAHAEELFKSKGDPVETDEVIATVGETASLTGSNLYFEVRHHGKSMDPLKWLKKS